MIDPNPSSALSLNRLPRDLIRDIASHLDHKSLVRAYATSRHMRDALQDPLRIRELRQCVMDSVAQGHKCDDLTTLPHWYAAINPTKPWEDQPIKTAIESGRWRQAVWLMDHGACVKATRDTAGQGPLHWLVQSRDRLPTEAFRHLIQVVTSKGGIIDQRDARGRTPLFMSLEKRQEERSQRLLEAGADPALCDGLGASGLHLAARMSLPLLRQCFQKSPASLNQQDKEGMTPLHTALQVRQYHNAEFLLRMGANLWLKNFRGEAPAHIMARHGNLGLILQRAPDPLELNNVNERGQSVVHLAIEGGIEEEPFRELLELGADVCLKDHEGQTPLTLVASQESFTNNQQARSIQLIELLVAKGAPIDGRDDQGMTPLHWAARRGQEPLVEKLLALGADPSLERGGKTYQDFLEIFWQESPYMRSFMGPGPLWY